MLVKTIKKPRELLPLPLEILGYEGCSLAGKRRRWQAVRIGSVRSRVRCFQEWSIEGEGVDFAWWRHQVAVCVRQSVGQQLLKHVV